MIRSGPAAPRALVGCCCCCTGMVPGTGCPALGARSRRRGGEARSAAAPLQLPPLSRLLSALSVAVVALLLRLPWRHAPPPWSPLRRCACSSRSVAQCLLRKCLCTCALSDLASALWNFAAMDDAARPLARAAVARCGLREAIQRQLTILRNICGPKVDRVPFREPSLSFMPFDNVDDSNAASERSTSDVAQTSTSAFGGRSIGKALEDRNHGWARQSLRVDRKRTSQSLLPKQSTQASW